MCGIVGYCEFMNTKNILHTVIGRLEYWGYDSNRNRVINENEMLKIIHETGEILDLRIFFTERKTEQFRRSHKRWPTYERINKINFHSHILMKINHRCIFTFLKLLSIYCIFFMIIHLNLPSYYYVLELGRDVDQSRDYVISVMVE